SGNNTNRNKARNLENGVTVVKDFENCIVTFLIYQVLSFSIIVCSARDRNAANPRD
ncbi:MAG: hypothetical protein UU14_C0023G0026, partial [Candidatus Roizmanbacteria bacterium GW2011_GWB1_40_7]